MIILRNNSHGGIIRVCMGIFTTALRNKKYVKFSKKKNLTLLPQCVACYLTAYFDEKSPFKQVVYFEVFNVHKKSLRLNIFSKQPCLFHMGAPQLSPKNGGHKISSPSRESFNPLHPSIDRNILHSVLNTFHMVLTGTIF